MLIKFPDRISQGILQSYWYWEIFYIETIITSDFQTICLLSIQLKLPNKLKREVSSQLNVTKVGDKHGGLRLNSQFDCKSSIVMLPWRPAKLLPAPRRANYFMKVTKPLPSYSFTLLTLATNNLCYKIRIIAWQCSNFFKLTHPTFVFLFQPIYTVMYIQNSI